MAHFSQSVVEASSSTEVFTDKRGLAQRHFKWESINKFLYIAFAFATTSTNFDIFANVYDNVRLYDFLACEVFVGITYMFMDFFIKQYTRTVDFNNNLNPFLKGITIGILLQTALWAMLHASDLADSIRYLFVFLTNLKSDPMWAACDKSMNNTCVSPNMMITRCQNGNITKFKNTSAYLHYMKSFTNIDKNVITVRFFATALVWILTFFCTTVTTHTLIMMFKLSFLWRVFSTFLILCVTIYNKKQHSLRAITQILNVSAPSSFANAMDHVSYAYGIGFIGIYDFKTMSPYTMVDNAVILFSILFTLCSFARSLMMKTMYLVLTSCVEVEISFTPHFLLFAILPMSSEFFYAHKLYIIYTYVNLMLATNAYLAVITLTMSKLLHSEFRSVKSMYIVGILCFLGFSLSVPVTVQSMLSGSRHQGLIYGLKVTVLYLGGFKVAVIMWIYGTGRFSTDIHFWLGFKPTKFWTICWMFLPIVLFGFFLNRMYNLIIMKDFPMVLTACLWIGFSILIVAIVHIRTLSSYILNNNLAKAFSSNSKYGPPEPGERKKRRNYNETIQLRRCIHNCNVLDDTFDCNHLPLRHKSKTRLSSTSSSESASLENIYRAKSVLRSTMVTPNDY